MPVITYEAGEALRLCERDIVTGVRGIVSTMRQLGMLTHGRGRRRVPEPSIARATRWYRAPIDGVYRPLVSLGDRVRPGSLLGVLSSPFSSQETTIEALAEGIVIGINNLPLVNEGEALCHLALFSASKAVEDEITTYDEVIETDPLYGVEQVEDVDLG